MTRDCKKYFLFTLILINIFTFSSDAQQITLINNSSAPFVAPVSLPVSAEVSGVAFADPTFLKIENSKPGFRRLAMGFGTENLNEPVMNPLAGENNMLEISFRILSPTPAEFDKILVRPMGIGDLSVASYVEAAGGIHGEWITIRIPLIDFDSKIDFSHISNIEFPYSSDAAPFVMALASVRFTGGPEPLNWFGKDKTDNFHNGNGGAGELSASLVTGNYPEIYAEHVEFLVNNSVTFTDYFPPYHCTLNNLQTGEYSILARLITSGSQVLDSQVETVTVISQLPGTFSVNLTSGNDSLEAPATITLDANISGIQQLIPDHLLVINNQSGYRKLKLGYHKTNLYSPGVNVIAGGNTMMEITLRDVNGNADWSKIQIRPSGIGSLCLLPYINNAGGIGTDWKTITIPLTDFDNSIPFNSIANIEFPYSASAPEFQLAIRSIRFIGSTTPFVWFGYGKTDNIHNGNGGSGELIASLFQNKPGDTYLEKVEFYQGDEKIFEDPEFPYQMNLSNVQAGTYPFTAKGISNQGETITSDLMLVNVYETSYTASTISVAITSPVAGTSWLAPLNLPVSCQLNGVVTQAPDYLEVINNLSGYYKMKLGYSATSFITPTQNVSANGNDTLEIVLKDIDGTINWSKIRIRPQGIGTLNLSAYAQSAGGVGSSWKTIRIPLSDFDSTIDFSALSYFEFPYSAGAGNFRIGIQSMRFTGGSSPFNWFGFGKTDNLHDGTGAAGKMTASIVSPNALAVNAAAVMLYDNGNLVATDTIAPWTPILPNPAPGVHKLWIKMTDTRGGMAFSDTVTVNVISQVPEGHLLITVNFSQAPDSLTFNKAKLRYDKDFAYSLSLDDGLIDAYTCAFRLMNGGYNPQTLETYPGLFYTDGCGNSVPFAGSLMWYSVNSSFNDIHVNTPSYVSWSQLNEMIDAGWGVVNHSYSHSTNPATTNYDYQIAANDSAVFSRTGIRMNHFVEPGGVGSSNYWPLAWEKGTVCTYNRNTSQGNPFGLNIKNHLNYDRFTIYRDYKIDGTHTPSNIMDGINNCALQSTNGNHLWYNDFTHHVSPTSFNGSLIFSTFRYYMEQIEALYGQSGSDRAWVASGVEVFEYLKLRDSSIVSHSLYGNQLRIMVDRTNIPDNLLKYAMSFTIEANADITSVTVNDPGTQLTWRGNTAKKLINVEWSEVTLAPPAPGAVFGDNTGSTQTAFIRQIENTNTLVISLPSDVDASGTLSLHDFYGNEVYSRMNQSEAVNGSVKMDVTGLPKGTYIVRFTGVDGIAATGRFCQPQ